MERHIPHLLKDLGIHRGRVDILSSALIGLDNLAQQGGSFEFTFVHLLNILWQPILEYINGLADGDEPAWSESLDKHQQALLAEMDGVVDSASEVLDFADWVELLRKTLEMHLDVDVPT